MPLLSLFLALLLPATLPAADPTGFALWHNSDLKPVKTAKIALKSLGNWGNHSANLIQRTATGEAEIHEHVVDLFVILSGEATLVVGGKAPNAKRTAPGELRGPSTEGGEHHRIGAGDIVHISANTPHQVLLDPGKQVTYFAVKIR